MNITGAKIITDEKGYNEMPERAYIEARMDKIVHGRRIIDTDKPYWKNSTDTLVFEIDGDELYRFGGKAIADTMRAIGDLIDSTNPDEVHTEQKGAKLVYRLWWD